MEKRNFFMRSRQEVENAKGGKEWLTSVDAKVNVRGCPHSEGLEP